MYEMIESVRNCIREAKWRMRYVHITDSGSVDRGGDRQGDQ